MARIALALALCLSALAQKKPVTLDVAAQPPAVKDAVSSPVWAPDSQSFAWIAGSNVHLYDVANKSRKQLLSLDAMEKSAVQRDEPRPFEWQNRRVAEQKLQWTPDGKRLMLLVKGDLFLYDIPSGKYEQITATPEPERDPKLSPDGKTLSFSRANEMWVLDLGTRKARRLTSDGGPTVWNGRLDWVYPEELGLGNAHWWSPDSNRIAFLQFDVSREWIHPHANLLDIKAIYEPQRYPKAGTPNPDVRLAVVDVAKGKVKWMDLGDARGALLARVDWLPDSTQVAVQKLNRVQTTVQLLFADADTGRSRVVISETDPHWVNLSDDLRFLKGRREFLWSDESTGYRHLYLYSYEGKRLKQLTSGEWEMKSLAAVDEERGVAYYLSRERSPLSLDLASVPLTGGKPTRITEEAGARTVSVAPDASMFLDTFSSNTQPTVKTLRRMSGKSIDVVQPPNPAIAEYEFIRPEFLQIKAQDGDTLYARLIRPKDFDPSKKYPAIVGVYGGPHAQNVCECYTGLSYEQALAQRGYVVWQLDNRGTASRGKAFETKLYRRLGKQELEDQIVGVRHLMGMGFVDPKRIAIHGWSYGGFMTLYAMLNAPDLFRAGIAGAPVVDWRLYDTIYTERYLKLPQENEEGYRLSSPIHYAKNLASPLMLIHNYSDDNVLFQNTMQMSVALEEAGKQFDTQIYPQHAHGVTGKFRKHMFETMTAFFDRHLKQ